MSNRIIVNSFQKSNNICIDFSNNTEIEIITFGKSRCLMITSEMQLTNLYVFLIHIHSPYRIMIAFVKKPNQDANKMFNFEEIYT